jgi:hypothetical protein
MTLSRKKPGVAFWAAVVLVIGLLYVASFGPACWLCDRDLLPAQQTRGFYNPVLAAIVRSPRPVQEAAMVYCDLMKPPEQFVGSGKWWILTDETHRRNYRRRRSASMAR